MRTWISDFHSYTSLLLLSTAGFSFAVGYRFHSRHIRRLRKRLIEMERELLSRDAAELEEEKNSVNIVSLNKMEVNKPKLKKVL